MLIIAGWPLAPALAAGLLIGVGVGLVNGLLSTYGRLPSLIATLGMLSIVRGSGADPHQRPAGHRQRPQRRRRRTCCRCFRSWARAMCSASCRCSWSSSSSSPFSPGWCCPTPISASACLRWAAAPRPRASRASPVNAVKIWAFVLMGLLAAFAGILSLAFLPSGQAGRTGLGLELDVIAATIVGGASLAGGEGTILGTILGVLIIGVMRNGLVLMGVSPFVQELMIGLVIIIAVGIDKWTMREPSLSATCDKKGGLSMKARHLILAAALCLWPVPHASARSQAGGLSACRAHQGQGRRRPAARHLRLLPRRLQRVRAVHEGRRRARPRPRIRSTPSSSARSGRMPTARSARSRR